MRPRHERQAIIMVKSLRYILPERVARPSRRDPPATPVVGIAPQQVAHRPLVRHLLDPVQGPDVVQSVDAGGQAAVQAEDLVVDEGGEGEVVEEIGEVFPDVGVAVLAQALVVEAVHLRDLARFVVAPQNRDALGVADFERDEEGDGLDGVVASVDVVALRKVSVGIEDVGGSGVVPMKR